MTNDENLSTRVARLERKVEKLTANQKQIAEVLEETRNVAKQTLKLLQSLNLEPKTNDNENN